MQIKYLKRSNVILSMIMALIIILSITSTALAVVTLSGEWIGGKPVLCDNDYEWIGGKPNIILNPDYSPTVPQISTIQRLASIINLIIISILIILAIMAIASNDAFLLIIVVLMLIIVLVLTFIYPINTAITNL